MTGILAFITSKWGARIIGAALALGLLVWAALWLEGRGYDQGVADTESRYERVLSEQAREREALANAYREQERAHAIEVARLADEYQENLSHEKKEFKRIIGDVRAGRERLRERFTCPDTAGVPEADASAQGSDERAARGLQTEDAEFLVRFANEADELAQQLATCQSILREDRSKNRAK